MSSNKKIVKSNAPQPSSAAPCCKIFAKKGEYHKRVKIRERKSKPLSIQWHEKQIELLKGLLSSNPCKACIDGLRKAKYWHEREIRKLERSKQPPKSTDDPNANDQSITNATGDQASLQADVKSSVGTEGGG